MYSQKMYIKNKKTMKYFKYVLILVVILPILSCNPCKMLSKRCKPETKDSIIYIEKVKLDTVRFILPGDTTIIEIPVDLTDYSLLEENAKQKIQLNILKGKLRLITICKDDSLKTVIANLEKQKQNIKTVYVDKEVIKFKTRPFFIYCTIGLFVIIILTLGWTFLKYKAKILGLFK